MAAAKKEKEAMELALRLQNERELAAVEAEHQRVMAEVGPARLSVFFCRFLSLAAEAAALACNGCVCAHARGCMRYKCVCI